MPRHPSSRKLPPVIAAAVAKWHEENPHAPKPERRAQKYNARRVEADGYSFASAKEARRYGVLRELLVRGVIQQLQVHPSWTFEVNGTRIGRYTADFEYVDTESGARVVEDVKGGTATRTEAYKLRKRMMLAFYGIEVMEV